MVTDGAGDGDDTGTAISDPVNTIDTTEVEAEPFQTVHPIDQRLLDSADPSTVFTAGRRGGHGAHTTKGCTSGFSNNGDMMIKDLIIRNSLINISWTVGLNLVNLSFIANNITAQCSGPYSTVIGPPKPKSVFGVRFYHNYLLLLSLLGH